MEQIILYLFLGMVAWFVWSLVGGYSGYKKLIMSRSHGERAPPTFRAFLRHQWRPILRQEKPPAGEVNLSGVLMIGIGMIFLAIGFIMLPIMATATSTILAWTYSANATIDDGDFTGYSAVVGITPLLVLVGFLVAGVVVGFLGFKVFKSGGGSSVQSNPGTLILLGLSIIFISISLIIEPVMLDGVAGVAHGGGGGQPHG